MKGIHIAFEGIDGSGKSLMARMAHEHLGSCGLPSLLTFEPTKGPIGAIIRDSLDNVLLQPGTEALLFAADRIQHQAEVIDPAVERGEIVVSDRYLMSSLAYQQARGLSLESLRSVNRWAREPDLTFLMDVPAETGVSRLNGSDNFENIEFLSKVRDRYLELADSMENVVIIDATPSIDDVWDSVRSGIDDAVKMLKP